MRSKKVNDLTFFMSTLVMRHLIQQNQYRLQQATMKSSLIGNSLKTMAAAPFSNTLYTSMMVSQVRLEKRTLRMMCKSDSSQPYDLHKSTVPLITSVKLTVSLWERITMRDILSHRGWVWSSQLCLRNHLCLLKWLRIQTLRRLKWIWVQRCIMEDVISWAIICRWMMD